MAIYDILVAVAVLVGIFILAYCRITGKSLIELFHEVREMIAYKTEEVTTSPDVSQYYE